MAYAYTVAFHDFGPKIWMIVIQETGATSSSVATIPVRKDAANSFNFTSARVMSVKCEISSGTGTTIQPQLNTAGTAMNDVHNAYKADSASSLTDEYSLVGVPFILDGVRLFHRSNVDTGSDNAITTKYIIKGD